MLTWISAAFIVPRTVSIVRVERTPLDAKLYSFSFSLDVFLADMEKQRKDPQFCHHTANASSQEGKEQSCCSSVTCFDCKLMQVLCSYGKGEWFCHCYYGALTSPLMVFLVSGDNERTEFINRLKEARWAMMANAIQRGKRVCPSVTSVSKQDLQQQKTLIEFFLVTCELIQMPQHCHKEIVYKLAISEKTGKTYKKDENETYKHFRKQTNRYLTSANNCHAHLLILNLAGIPFPALFFLYACSLILSLNPNNFPSFQSAMLHAVGPISLALLLLLFKFSAQATGSLTSSPCLLSCPQPHTLPPYSQLSQVPLAMYGYDLAALLQTVHVAAALTVRPTGLPHFRSSPLP